MLVSLKKLKAFVEAYELLIFITLKKINSLWVQVVEDIFLDPTTCAMAFCILRLNGYDVSSGWIICNIQAVQSFYLLDQDQVS